MENRLDEVRGSEIPRKPRSLDLKSLYESKPTESNDVDRSRKRNGVDHDCSHKKKKSRKEVSISSLENSNGNASKSSEEVCKAVLSPKSPGSKNSKVELHQKLNDVKGFNGVPLGVGKIPKRRRDFVGRRKVENNSQVSKGNQHCGVKYRNIDEVGRLDEASGVASDPLELQRRTDSDELAETRNGKVKVDGNVERDFGKHNNSVVKNENSSPKGCHDDQNNGDLSGEKPIKKRKRSRKKNDLTPDSRSIAREVEQATGTSTEVDADVQKEDEENLEENAARMLSSRFNPSCAGFPINAKVSAHEFANCRSNSASRTESASVDPSDRVLSSRKDHNEKGNSRKRRHFYEICSGDLDAYWVLNRKIKVYWPLDESWYVGLVSEYDKERNLHHVKYDDRDEEWINLQSERFKLLLLPSEAPEKSRRRRNSMGKKHTEEENTKLTSDKEKKIDLTPADERNAGNHTDSEPIISWLARSPHKVKSSPLCATKKQKTSGTSSPSPLLSEEAYDSGGGSMSKGKSTLASKCPSPGRLATSGRQTPSASETTCPKDNKFIVYYRRRFRNTRHKSNNCRLSIKANASGTSPAPGTVSIAALEKVEINPPLLGSDGSMGKPNPVESLWSIDSLGRLKLNLLSMRSRKFRFQLINLFPLNNLPIMRNTWFTKSGLLSHPGTLTTIWPRVNLEMFFVDNVVGLKLLLFEGCLKQVLAFAFLVLRVFQQSCEQGNTADFQFPVTSIRFKFSCLTGSKKQLMFAFYKFSVVGNSKWTFLDHKLSRHCMLAKQLPLSECTYNGIKALQNGNTRLLCPTGSMNSVLPKDRQSRSRHCVGLMSVSRRSGCMNASQITSNSGKNPNPGKFPPFLLSFSAAPTFFVGLHLKLLMEHTLSPNGFWDHSLIDDQENSEIQLAENRSAVNYHRDSEINVVQNSEFHSEDSDCDGCFCSSTSRLQTLSVSTCSNGDQSNISLENQSHNAGGDTSASMEEPIKLVTVAIDPLEKLQSNQSVEEQLHLLPRVTTIGEKSCVESFANLEDPKKLGTIATDPSEKLQSNHLVEEQLPQMTTNGDKSSAKCPTILENPTAIDSSEKLQSNRSVEEQVHLLPQLTINGDQTHAGSESIRNGLKVDIPPCIQFEERVNKEVCCSQSHDVSWNMNNGVNPESNPTLQRNNWHQNSARSSAHGYFPQGRSNGRADFLQNSFHNGPKKPRTQVSYALPFGAYEYSKNNKSYQQKGLLHKRIRTSNEKRSSDSSRGSDRNIELSCEANVLITLVDRGRRECGAQVVLELFDHNEWRLGVKLSGITKYSYKAHQFLQPGTVNRHTHAMMWKGGKDWILEFPDRSQWACFKEMHEECYNRNFRAALTKNIPIPGVRVIEETDDNGIEIPFFRSPIYFQQLETDVEIALNPLRVLYDMDSDDEEWLLKTQNSSEGTSCLQDISDDIFEKTMDMFEKAAYNEKRDHLASDEVEELLAGVVPVHVVKIIYDYWLKKRQRKGMPLIRHLQPPLWQRYEEQVKEWELATAKGKNGHSSGSQAKVSPTEKPPMFAFCMRPRGLDEPNKGSKQRSQRKFVVSGQRSNVSGYHDGHQFHGRRSNGIASGEEMVYPGRYYESLEDSPFSQVSPRMFSPRDEVGPGYFKMRTDSYDRNPFHRLHRSYSKNPVMYASPVDSPITASHGQRIFDKGRVARQWHMRVSDRSSQHQYVDGSFGQGIEHLDNSDLDELRWRDASAGAKQARMMAKLKRERAQKLLYRADLAMQKAAAALMTADVIKASAEDLHGEWSRQAK